ncbi:hypothetical protein ABWH91_15100 [Phycisphaerales bacterium ac7]
MANNEPEIASGPVPPLPGPEPAPAHMSPAEFRELGHRMVDYIADYYERLNSAGRPDVLPREAG